MRALEDVVQVTCIKIKFVYNLGWDLVKSSLLGGVLTDLTFHSFIRSFIKYYQMSNLCQVFI